MQSLRREKNKANHTESTFSVSTRVRQVVERLCSTRRVIQLEIGQKEFQQYFPKAGWVEHDALEILDNQIECIKSAIVDAKKSTVSKFPALVSQINAKPLLFGTEKRANQSTGQLSGNVAELQKLLPHFKVTPTGFETKLDWCLMPTFQDQKIAWILDNVEGARKLANDGELAFGDD